VRLFMLFSLIFWRPVLSCWSDINFLKMTSFGENEAKDVIIPTMHPLRKGSTIRRNRTYIFLLVHKKKKMKNSE
jgi:hypothetical protein